MSKIFSEIKKLPGNSGKSSTASGMTRYAVNKTFAKGALMQKKSSKQQATSIAHSVGSKAINEALDKLDRLGVLEALMGGKKQTQQVVQQVTQQSKKGKTPKLGVPKMKASSTPTPPHAATPSTTTPTVVTSAKPAATGTATGDDIIIRDVAAMPVSFASQLLGGTLGQISRAPSRVQSWSKTWIADRKLASRQAKEKQRELLLQEIENLDKDEQTNRNLAETTRVAGLKAAQDIADSWAKKPNRARAIVYGGLGTGAWHLVPEERRKKITDSLFGKRDTRKKYTSSSLNKRMIRKNDTEDSITDFINGLLTPNTGVSKLVSEKTKQYAPVVSAYKDRALKEGERKVNEYAPVAQKYGNKALKEGERLGRAALREIERMGRNTYGGALNIGGQIMRLGESEGKKGIGPRSKKLVFTLPATSYTPEMSSTINVPTMEELYARAKTVGARKQTGRYDESNAVERALQVVRDWGEKNLPTPKNEIKGLPNDFQNKRGRVRVQDGELVPYYQDVSMGNKEPKGIKREDLVYGTGSSKSKNPIMQIWETATMKPKSSWKPQKQVKDKKVYDSKSKRYVSTAVRDSDDITDFEQTQRKAKIYASPSSSKSDSNSSGRSRYVIEIDPSRLSKSMRKSVSSMRNAGVRHVVGGYRGGKAMMKAFYGSGINNGRPSMPPSTPTPTPSPNKNKPPRQGYIPPSYTPGNAPSMGGRSMMKSVSSMRNAGVRHVVGGYRGGSKLHKAATPTLATRNFRNKFE